MKPKNRFVRGVTLVEIAIVLVIIGLLLGGILKGQELINNARVRAIADRQAGLKVAWYAFLDRYQGLPGDLWNANRVIQGSGANRIGQTDGKNTGDGFIHEEESAIVFQQLTAAGFLRCPNCTETNLKAVTDLNAGNTLVNSYGGVMAIFMDESYYGTQSADRQARLMSQTGSSLPSNIIRDVDRKIDDGLPFVGDFVASLFRGSAPSVGKADCLGKSDGSVTAKTADTYVTADPTDIWRPASVEPIGNCSGAVIF